MARCLPCQSDHHLECGHRLSEPCDCFVCIAGRIGARVTAELPPPADERDGWETVERDE